MTNCAEHQPNQQNHCRINYQTFYYNRMLRISQIDYSICKWTTVLPLIHAMNPVQGYSHRSLSQHSNADSQHLHLGSRSVCKHGTALNIYIALSSTNWRAQTPSRRPPCAGSKPNKYFWANKNWWLRMDRDSIRIKYRFRWLFGCFNETEAFHFHVVDSHQSHLKCFESLSWPAWFRFNKQPIFVEEKEIISNINGYFDVFILI